MQLLNSISRHSYITPTVNYLDFKMNDSLQQFPDSAVHNNLYLQQKTTIDIQSLLSIHGLKPGMPCWIHHAQVPWCQSSFYQLSDTPLHRLWWVHSIFFLMQHKMGKKTKHFISEGNELVLDLPLIKFLGIMHIAAS